MEFDLNEIALAVEQQKKTLLADDSKKGFVDGDELGTMGTFGDVHNATDSGSVVGSNSGSRTPPTPSQSNQAIFGASGLHLPNNGATTADNPPHTYTLGSSPPSSFSVSNNSTGAHHTRNNTNTLAEMNHLMMNLSVHKPSPSVVASATPTSVGNTNNAHLINHCNNGYNSSSSATISRVGSTITEGISGSSLASAQAPDAFRDAATIPEVKGVPLRTNRQPLRNYESTAGIFVGQLPVLYSPHDVVQLLCAVGAESGVDVQVKDVKMHPRNTCAFVDVNAECVAAIVKYNRLVLCDVNTLWMAQNPSRVPELLQVAERCCNRNFSGVPRTTVVLEQSTRDPYTGRRQRPAKYGNSTSNGNHSSSNNGSNHNSHNNNTNAHHFGGNSHHHHNGNNNNNHHHNNNNSNTMMAIQQMSMHHNPNMMMMNGLMMPQQQQANTNYSGGSGMMMGHPHNTMSNNNANAQMGLLMGQHQQQGSAMMMGSLPHYNASAMMAQMMNGVNPSAAPFVINSNAANVSNNNAQQLVNAQRTNTNSNTATNATTAQQQQQQQQAVAFVQYQQQQQLMMLLQQQQQSGNNQQQMSMANAFLKANSVFGGGGAANAETAAKSNTSTSSADNENTGRFTVTSSAADNSGSTSAVPSHQKSQQGPHNSPQQQQVPHCSSCRVPYVAGVVTADCANKCAICFVHVPVNTIAHRCDRCKTHICLKCMSTVVSAGQQQQQ